MEIALSFKTLIELFNKSLLRSELASKPCLEIIRAERQETLTFEQLKTRAQNFALWLIEAGGIQVQDKIAILGKNRVDWDVALWGIMLAGAVPVLIDPERPIEAVKQHLTFTDARLIVVADDYQEANSRQELKEFAYSRDMNLIEMTDNLAHGKISFNTTMANELPHHISTEIKADDTAVILCTSGTTGDPREVELTHRNLISNIQGTLEIVDITDKDRLGHILPPHHSFGLTVGKLLPFYVGATNVYTNKYRQIGQLIKEKEITILVGTPALFTVIAKKMEDELRKQKEKSPLVRLFDRFFPGLIGKRIVVLEERTGTA